MSKLKILILVGLPASGKSTYAKDLASKDSSYVRINKDDFRTMIGGYVNDIHEPFIHNLETAAIKTALYNNLNIIIDAINLQRKSKKYYYKLALEYDCDIEEIIFDVPLDVCIERDSKRTNPVGSAIISEYYNKFINK